VKVIASVITGKLVSPAIEREAGILDAVGVTAYQGAEVRIGHAFVTGKVIESEGDIRRISVSVGNNQFTDGSSV
jgi:hypothetical protein